MKVSELFPGKYLTAADLNGKPFALIVRGMTLEEMQTHDHQMVKKPVLWFTKAQKGLVLNATNARTIAGLYGDDMEQWKGKRITIYPTLVKAFGKMEPAIRVKDSIPAEPTPTAKAEEVEESSELDDVEDVTDFEEPAN